NINGTGNELDNILTGNSGDNTLNGGTGNDTYIVDSIGDVIFENDGEGMDIVQSSISYALPFHVENLILTGNSNVSATGNDLDNTLTGNTGNNVLDGGAGNDMLT